MDLGKNFFNYVNFFEFYFKRLLMKQDQREGKGVGNGGSQKSKIFFQYSVQGNILIYGKFFFIFVIYF